MNVPTEDIQLTPEQQKLIADLAAKSHKSWQEVLHEILEDGLHNYEEHPIGPESQPRRKAGSAKGKIKLAPDFDAPLEEFEDYM